MAVTFDAVGPGAAGAAGTLLYPGTPPFQVQFNWNHVCSGSTRLLVVGVAIGNNAGQSDTGQTMVVTYNGVSMTPAGAIVHGNGGTSGFVQMFYLVAPDNGTNQVLVTVTTTGSVGVVPHYEAGSVSFNGVDQSTPVSNFNSAVGNGTGPSVVITSAINNMVVDALCAGSAISSSGKTLRWNNNQDGQSSAGNGAQSTASGGGSVTMSYTISADDWGIVGLNLIADAGVILAVVDHGEYLPPTGGGWDSKVTVW